MILNPFIDHTLLSPFASLEQVIILCEEAIEHEFYAVCVSPYFTRKCLELLRHSPIKVSSVIGFPYGYNDLESKRKDIESILDYTDEFDVVVNLNAVVNADWTTIEKEVNFVTNYVHRHEKIIKYIIESGNISKDQLRKLCQIGNQAGVDFIKTSTGVLGPGASVEDVRFIKEHVDDSIQIKASGGIRDRRTAEAMIEAGATRIGASKSIIIVSGS